MGRKRKSEIDKPEKKTATKMQLIPRMHAGKVTEPYAIMESLIAEKPCFEHLKDASIKLWWRKDWKVDVDGIATGAQCCKASELDRNLAEQNDGDQVDLFIKLPREQWPTLDETEKKHRIFHELCHFRPALNAEGQQKRDTKDRLLWRLKRHPIVAFYEEVEEFGIERIVNHNEAVMEAIRLVDRPMEKLFDEAEEKKATKATKAANAEKIVTNVVDDTLETNILRMSNQGSGARKIAKELGVSERQVRKVLGKL